jgi:hypothetical protein
VGAGCLAATESLFFVDCFLFGLEHVLPELNAHIVVVRRACMCARHCPLYQYEPLIVLVQASVHSTFAEPADTLAAWLGIRHLLRARVRCIVSKHLGMGHCAHLLPSHPAALESQAL